MTSESVLKSRSLFNLTEVIPIFFLFTKVSTACKSFALDTPIFKEPPLFVKVTPSCISKPSLNVQVLSADKVNSDSPCGIAVPSTKCLKEAFAPVSSIFALSKPRPTEKVGVSVFELMNL